MKMKLREVYSALKITSENVADVEITGVCFDSRKAKAGDLFFPLQGVASSCFRIILEHLIFIVSSRKHLRKRSRSK